ARGRLALALGAGEVPAREPLDLRQQGAQALPELVPRCQRLQEVLVHYRSPSTPEGQTAECSSPNEPFSRNLTFRLAPCFHRPFDTTVDVMNGTYSLSHKGYFS